MHSNDNLAVYTRYVPWNEVIEVDIEWLGNGIVEGNGIDYN